MSSAWSLSETAFDVRNNRHYEGLFAIGSGPLQQRAALEEGLADDPQDVEYLRVMGNVTVEQFPDFKSRVGTYLPGVSGPHPTCRDELINLPAIHGLIIFAAGQRLDMQRCTLRDYERRLDLRTARLSRQFVWQTQTGALLRIRFERFISAQRRFLMPLHCSVEHLSGPPTELRFIATLDAEVRTNGFDHFTSVDITGEHEPITLAVRTNGGTDVAAAALVTGSRSVAWSVDAQSRWVGLSGGLTLDPDQVVHVTKFAALTSSRHVRGAPVDAARRMVWDAAGVGYEQLALEHDAVWETRWNATDVVVEGDPASQLALRASLYHMLRAVVEDDPRVAIDAKAAAGEAYCGRYFWDTELFILPLFLYTRPQVGATLARFRHRSLPGARRNAQRYGYPGARYAWESAPSGDDNCPNWQYADHEVHVTADAAYGLWHAHLVNPDDAALLREAVEVLIETSRYWVARLHHDAVHDRYDMLMVMGPDEYTPFSRNNAYTNRLAALNLALAQEGYAKLRATAADAADKLAAQLQLQPGELEHYADVARKLPIPRDAVRDLVLQSADFFSYEPLDFAQVWPDRRKRIGAVVSQERLYRSQVLKQADVVQLMVLFPQEFSAAQMRLAYDTYEPLTSHDSSLSKPMHALLAAWLGLDDVAWRMWQDAVGLDLQSGEAAEGIHAACAGANWQVAVFGFAGVRTRMQAEVLHLEPHLPAAWQRLRFPFVWDGQSLQIDITRAAVTIVHGGTRPVAARVRGRDLTLTPGQTVQV